MCFQLRNTSMNAERWVMTNEIKYNDEQGQLTRFYTYFVDPKIKTYPISISCVIFLFFSPLSFRAKKKNEKQNMRMKQKNLNRFINISIEQTHTSAKIVFLLKIFWLFFSENRKRWRDWRDISIEREKLHLKNKAVID